MKYKDKLEAECHARAKEIDILADGKTYVALKDGMNPMPDWVVEIAVRFKRDAVTVLTDAIKYRNSFGFQKDKAKFAIVK